MLQAINLLAKLPTLNGSGYFKTYVWRIRHQSSGYLGYKRAVVEI